jgi:hypothetical protein
MTDISNRDISNPIGRYESAGRWTGAILGYGVAGALGWKAAAALFAGKALVVIGAVSISPLLGVLAVAGALAAAAFVVSKLTNSHTSLGPDTHPATKLAGAPMGISPIVGLGLLATLGGMLNTFRCGPGGASASFPCTASTFATFSKMSAGLAGLIALTTIPFSCSELLGGIGRHRDNQSSQRVRKSLSGAAL